jgi:hypothetical protein
VPIKSLGQIAYAVADILRGQLDEGMVEVRRGRLHEGDQQRHVVRRKPLAELLVNEMNGVEHVGIGGLPGLVD